VRWIMVAVVILCGLSLSHATSNFPWTTGCNPLFGAPNKHRLCEAFIDIKNRDYRELKCTPLAKLKGSQDAIRTYCTYLPK
jgi:hypothetical protein